jgi:hypothetical protein
MHEQNYCCCCCCCPGSDPNSLEFAGRLVQRTLLSVAAAGDALVTTCGEQQRALGSLFAVWASREVRLGMVNSHRPYLSRERGEEGGGWQERGGVGKGQPLCSVGQQGGAWVAEGRAEGKGGGGWAGGERGGAGKGSSSGLWAACWQCGPAGRCVTPVCVIKDGAASEGGGGGGMGESWVGGLKREGAGCAQCSPAGSCVVV